ncbi:MAG: DNA polymerase III subunit delta' [Pseudomonadota bacterium]
MWTQIIGHKSQLSQLQKTILNQQIPNAYLFSGLKGIGKSLVAKVFAKSLFCESSPEVCDICGPCSKIENRTHPDVFFIEPLKDRILIEQVRQLRQDLQFHPLEGSFKIIIINDVETMTESAANALLKILEEPPPQTHFILVTAQAQRLLPTIRSRCRQLVFSPLPEAEVLSYLISKGGSAKEHTERLARLSQGSIGAIAQLDEKFMAEVLERFQIIVNKANAADIIALAEIWDNEKDRTDLIFDLLAHFYRDSLCGCHDFRQNSSYALMEKDFFKVVKTKEIMLSTTANKQLLFEELLFNLTSR